MDTHHAKDGHCSTYSLFLNSFRKITILKRLFLSLTFSFFGALEERSNLFCIACIYTWRHMSVQEGYIYGMTSAIFDICLSFYFIGFWLSMFRSIFMFSERKNHKKIMKTDIKNRRRHSIDTPFVLVLWIAQ